MQQESKTETLLLGLGNPLLDISSQVGQEVLDKYEMKTNSAILMEDKHMPLFQDLVKMPTVQFIPGGSTLNSIRTSQWLLKSQHSGKCAYMGCISKDDTGNILSDILLKETVNAKFSIDQQTPTGKCAVLVHDNDRALGAYLGAAIKYPTQHLKSNMYLLEQARLIYSASFFLTSNKEAMLQSAKYASQHKKQYGFNLSAFFLIDQFKEQMLQLIKHSDFVFGNETQAAHFSKAHEFGTENIVQIAKNIAKMEKVNQDHPRYVIITQGKDPTVVVKHDPKNSQDLKVDEYPVIKLPKEKIVDTNGAGDSFVGGFLAGIALGKSTKIAVAAGQYCASQIIQRSGCTFPEKMEFQI